MSEKTAKKIAALTSLMKKQLDTFEALVEKRGYTYNKEVREFYHRGRLDQDAWIKLLNTFEEEDTVGKWVNG